MYESLNFSITEQFDQLDKNALGGSLNFCVAEQSDRPGNALPDPRRPSNAMGVYGDSPINSNSSNSPQASPMVSTRVVHEADSLSRLSDLPALSGQHVASARQDTTLGGLGSGGDSLDSILSGRPRPLSLNLDDDRLDRLAPVAEEDSVELTEQSPETSWNQPKSSHWKENSKSPRGLSPSGSQSNLSIGYDVSVEDSMELGKCDHVEEVVAAENLGPVCETRNPLEGGSSGWHGDVSGGILDDKTGITSGSTDVLGGKRISFSSSGTLSSIKNSLQPLASGGRCGITGEQVVPPRSGRKHLNPLHLDPLHDADFAGSPLGSSAGSSRCGLSNDSGQPRGHRIQLDPLHVAASNAPAGGSTSLPESSGDVWSHDERDRSSKQGGGSASYSEAASDSGLRDSGAMGLSGHDSGRILESQKGMFNGSVAATSYSAHFPDSGRAPSEYRDDDDEYEEASFEESIAEMLSEDGESA